MNIESGGDLLSTNGCIYKKRGGSEREMEGCLIMIRSDGLMK